MALPYNNALLSERYCLKKRGGERQKTASDVGLRSPNAHMHTQTCSHVQHTHTYTHTNFKMVTKLKPCKACGGTQCDDPAPTRKGWGPWIYPSWPRGTTSPTLLFSFLTVVIKSSNVSSFFFKFIFSQYANRNGFQWLLFQCNSFRKSKNAKHVCVYGNVDGSSIRRGHLCLFTVLMCPGF